MNTPAADDFPRELLAAYVDGELDEAGRAAVDRWLADHPDAIDLLNTQRELSPSNTPLWDWAEPPEPSEKHWAATRQAIGDRLAPSGGRWPKAVSALAGLAAAGIAAAVAWFAFGTNARPPHDGQEPSRELVQTRPEQAPAPREVAASRSDDPLAEFAVLPVAEDHDVILDRVPEFSRGWLPVGQHPLQAALSLASTEEIQVLDFAPSTIWPKDGPKMTTSPGDAPMIYAAKLR